MAGRSPTTASGSRPTCSSTPPGGTSSSTPTRAAARARSEEEVSADSGDPWRAVRQLRRAVRGRHAALRRPGVRRLLRQPARQHELDPKKKYPLILEIHGGPFANYGERFAADMQLYAARGYVVFYANPRGSTSSIRRRSIR